MANFIDRRLNSKNKSTVNRQRFLRRYKNQIKKSVADAINQRGVTDIDSGENIIIPKKDLSEPVFHQGSGGIHDKIHPGNDKFSPGDRIAKPPNNKDKAVVKEMPVTAAKVKTILLFQYRKKST